MSINRFVIFTVVALLAAVLLSGCTSASEWGATPSTDPAAWLKSGGLELANSWSNASSGGSALVTYGSGTGMARAGEMTPMMPFKYSIDGTQVTVVFQDGDQPSQVFEVTEASGSTFTNRPVGEDGFLNHGTWKR